MEVGQPINQTQVAERKWYWWLSILFETLIKFAFLVVLVLAFYYIAFQFSMVLCDRTAIETIEQRLHIVAKFLGHIGIIFICDDMERKLGW